MKYIIILMLFLVSCGPDKVETDPITGDIVNNIKISSNDRDFKSILIDGHRYLYRVDGNIGQLAHEGECPKCKENLKKLILECISISRNTTTIDSMNVLKSVIIDGKTFYVNSKTGELDESSKKYLKSKKRG